MNPENGFAGFRSRLARLVGGDEPFVWAKQVGIPSSTFDRIWNGGSVPKAETLLRIARHCGVSIDWLLTGEGQMRPGVQAHNQVPMAAIDPLLYGRALEQVKAAYEEFGITAALHQIGAKAAEIAGDLSGDDFPTWEEKLTALKGSVAQLRRQLKQQAAESDQAKRQA